MHILITGGCGFVGSHLCRFLKSKWPDYKITALDNFVRKGSELNVPLLRSMDIDIIRGDIRSQEAFDQMAPFDLMIDAAAEPSVLAGTHGDHRYLIDNNLIGTINCLDACNKNKARLIFISTSRVYPHAKVNELPYKEEETRYTFTPHTIEGFSEKGIAESFDTHGAKTFYGASKFASEIFIEEYRTALGLEAIINRCGIIAGPGQMGKVDQGIAVYWAAAYFWKKPLAYFGFNGSGKQVRDFLHINDLAALIIRQIESPHLFTDAVYQVGGGIENTLSLLELTEICQRISTHKMPMGRQQENRPGDIRIYYSDNGLIESHSGWKPTLGPTEIISDIFDWLEQDEDKLRKVLI